MLRNPENSDPFTALAFKDATDPFVGRLALRIYEGTLDAGSYVQKNRTGKKERIARLMQMHANKQNLINAVQAGDICAVVGFKEIKTEDTLTSEKQKAILEALTFSPFQNQ